MDILQTYRLFDSHFHIIDGQFPLVENQGFLPDIFPVKAYKKRLMNYRLAGGTVVSGSFQGLDQTYLINALKILGPTYTGVTQLPATVSDEEVIKLNTAGVRGVRFNLKRGGSEGLENLEIFSHRIYDLVGWHAELYVDSSELAPLLPILISLPKVSIAHLGLSRKGFTALLQLAEKGVKIKATGFYRIDFSVEEAIKKIASVNPESLIFGTDLPSTRADRPYSDRDFQLVVDTLGGKLAAKVFYDNAVSFYKPASIAGNNNLKFL